jgi:hypothetical protein
MTIIVEEQTISEEHSLLSIVQRFCERTGLPVPQTVYGSTNDQVTQIKALLEEEGNDLSSRGGAWEGLCKEVVHTTVASEDQGSITSICGEDFRYIRNQTIWDRTEKLPVPGPMSASEWQALKAMFQTGPRYRFRIRGGKLLANPTPPEGHEWAFEYVSKFWIVDETGTTYRQYFGADSDLVLMPAEIMLMGLRWRWKKEKGLEYAEDFRSYETQVKDALGRDGGKPVLSMSDEGCRVKPGIFVSPGSWQV